MISSLLHHVHIEDFPHPALDEGVQNLTRQRYILDAFARAQPASCVHALPELDRVLSEEDVVLGVVLLERAQRPIVLPFEPEQGFNSLFHTLLLF